MSHLLDDEGDIHHECGVAAVIDLDDTQNVVPITRDILLGLQHRGQLGAGLAWHQQIEQRRKVLHVIKDIGLIADVLSNERLIKESARGTAAIAHTRYATTANKDAALCHPFHYSKKDHPEFAFAFNGNIPDYARASRKLDKAGIEPRVHNSDTEIIGQSIVRHLLKDTSRKMRRALIDTLGEFDGACNAVVLSGNRRIFATRDKHGFHPLSYAQKGSLVAVASESSAIRDVWKKVDIRSIGPGQMLHIGPKGGVTVEQVWEAQSARCFMEMAYFANHRSIIDDVSVSNSRYECGKILAQLDAELPKADIVVPVPESAKTAARGYADVRGIRNVEAFLRKEGMKRTFIESEDREQKVRDKFDLDADLVRGKSVVLVDDSLVRGTTMSVLVKMLREAGAAQVHIRLGSPAIIAPCFYGIDFPTVSELLARKYFDINILKFDTLPKDVLQAIADDIGADSVSFLPVSALAPALECEEDDLCRACVTGTYPTDAGQKLYQLANNSNGYP